MPLHLFSDPSMIDRITKSLSIKLPAYVLRSKDPRAVLLSIFSAWLPLSTAVLVSVIEQLPSPPEAQASRLPALIDASPGASDIDPDIRSAMVRSDSDKTAPVIAFVSKMVAIPQSQMPENKRRGATLSAEEALELGRRKRAEIARAQALAAQDILGSTQGMIQSMGDIDINQGLADTDSDLIDQEIDPEHLIGFARIFSGTLTVGDEVYVLPPKFSPSDSHIPNLQRVTISALYLLMGRGLEPLQSVQAGMIFGVAGIEGQILKSGTLCSRVKGGINLAGINLGTQPIVRVALEPVNPSDLEMMIAGMQMLERSDPCAEYEVLESGEHVISTAGELHLERCLKDLRERFARCEIQASEPIIPYRETIVSAPEMAPLKDKAMPRGTVIGVSTSKQIIIRLRVRPIPPKVTEMLNKYSESIRKLGSDPQIPTSKGALPDEGNRDGIDQETVLETAGDGGIFTWLGSFRKFFNTALEESEADMSVWGDILESIAAFGPRRMGPNLLIDKTDSGCCQKLSVTHSASIMS